TAGAVVRPFSTRPAPTRAARNPPERIRQPAHARPRSGSLGHWSPPEVNMPVRIEGLGALRVSVDGVERSELPAKRKQCALLLVLGVERRISRDRVVDLMWPSDPENGRHRLSQTLIELRQSL